MILGNTRIKGLLSNGLTPNSADALKDVNPASLDIRLGRNALLMVKDSLEYGVTDGVGNKFTSLTLNKRTFLEPGAFMLIETMRYFRFPDHIGGLIRAKSSRGREGYELMDAGWVDPGYEGRLTLELVNHSNSLLPVFPGLAMAQIIFFDVDGCTEPYSGKYKGDVMVNYSQDMLEF